MALYEVKRQNGNSYENDFSRKGQLNMKFGYVYETGKRAENEDALLFRCSLLSKGELWLSAVCDGMGGMQNGMEASALCIREIETWFDRQLIPCICKYGKNKGKLEQIIKSKGFMLYRQMNRMLFEKMRTEDVAMGTTALMCILYRGRYYLFHIGDSRAYLLGKRMNLFICRQITKDHGNEQGLSRCLGLNREWKPDFHSGRIGKSGLLLCTDGFFRKFDKNIWKKCLDVKKMENEVSIGKRLKEIAFYNIRQKESDNISAIYMGGESQ